MHHAGVVVGQNSSPEHQVLESAENVGAPDEDDSLLFEFPDR